MVKVDKEQCIGCGICVTIADEVFELDGDKAIVIKQSAEPNVQEAQDECPVDAISCAGEME